MVYFHRRGSVGFWRVQPTGMGTLAMDAFNPAEGGDVAQR